MSVTEYSDRSACYTVYSGSPLSPPRRPFHGPLPELAQLRLDFGLSLSAGFLTIADFAVACGHLFALRLARLSTSGEWVEMTEAGVYRNSAVRLRGRALVEPCPHCGGVVRWQSEADTACDGCGAAWLPVFGKELRGPRSGTAEVLSC